tara:strand:- start:137 stop:370 length:234 start_codon:yes stop_codon:yes gene_type:complete
MENLNKLYSFKKRIPELVEKKEPPIITRIKNIKDKFEGLLSKENPILDILLVNESKIILKLLSKLKKNKKVIKRNKK